ncbi:hypothetical protein ANCCAN_21060 [Ancylostoma caninum]|uniref:Uncharacterized protein n=1 Tax=Ancylostoma caninum TaxID=29170 RepID=A0A368FSC2_ANCCA|nr:hypothetical protein ANCCAN_21060 [Ancylostoma caninum]
MAGRVSLRSGSKTVSLPVDFPLRAEVVRGLLEIDENFLFLCDVRGEPIQFMSTSTEPYMHTAAHDVLYVKVATGSFSFNRSGVLKVKPDVGGAIYSVNVLRPRHRSGEIGRNWSAVVSTNDAESQTCSTLTDVLLKNALRCCLGVRFVVTVPVNCFALFATTVSAEDASTMSGPHRMNFCKTNWASTVLTRWRLVRSAEHVQWKPEKL